MADEPRQITDFIKEHGITLHVIEGPTAGVDEDDGRKWPHVAWTVELRTPNGASIRTPWKAGIGHYKPDKKVLRTAQRISSHEILGRTIARKHGSRKLADGRIAEDIERVHNVTDNHAIAICQLARAFGAAPLRMEQTQAEAAAMVAQLQRITPDVADVLDSLRMDAQAMECSPGFEDFCAEFGYDTDSRRAEQMHRAVMESAGRMQSWLGLRILADLLESEGL